MNLLRSFFLLLLCPLLLLSSCTQNEAMPQEVLGALLETAKDVPSGQIYHSEAEEGSESYCSPELLTSLYGEEATERFETVEAYAIYLSSFTTPCELAVFRCYSASDANRIEALCLLRAEELRVALRNTPYEAVAQELRVILKGKWVFFLFCQGSEAVGQTALHAVT